MKNIDWGKVILNLMLGGCSVGVIFGSGLQARFGFLILGLFIWWMSYGLLKVGEEGNKPKNFGPSFGTHESPAEQDATPDWVGMVFIISSTIAISVILVKLIEKLF